ncbi:MAG: L,D-transpeptidase family protein [Campylobacterota bacterium]|nr:L,D-transpeptidase family protein [Campylobacterota bacterium]
MLKNAQLLFITLVINSSLFANSTLTDYRKNGLDNLEKKMDFQLTKKKYWSKYVKSQDTTFGYLEKYSNVLTCNKNRSNLILYTQNRNKKYYMKNKLSAYTGKNSGDKMKEGDSKTPVGLYDLTSKKSHKKDLDPFYGPFAFVTSYPNMYDKFQGKTGHGIWIHGLPKDDVREEFTRGCIAIQNDKLTNLEKKIDVSKTLLIIDDNWIKKDISKDTLSSILAQLYEWRYAWLYNNITDYLKFYSQDFIRSDGMSFSTFKRYKTRIFKKIEKKTIIFSDINVIPYPNRKNIYQITFKEYYKSNSFKFIGDKVLMVKVDKKNNMKIFTEK